MNHIIVHDNYWPKQRERPWSLEYINSSWLCSQKMCWKVSLFGDAFFLFKIEVFGSGIGIREWRIQKASQHQLLIERDMLVRICTLNCLGMLKFSSWYNQFINIIYYFFHWSYDKAIYLSFYGNGTDPQLITIRSIHLILIAICTKSHLFENTRLFLSILTRCNCIVKCTQSHLKMNLSYQNARINMMTT